MWWQWFDKRDRRTHKDVSGDKLQKLTQEKRGKRIEKGIPWEIRTIKNRLKMLKRERQKVKIKEKRKLIEDKK